MGRHQSTVYGRTIAAPGLMNHPSAEPGGHLRGAVGGAIVDHDRPISGREGGEHDRQRGRLVETGKDYLYERHTGTVWRLWPVQPQLSAYESLTSKQDVTNR
jgi:hypothetical protein